MKINLRVAAARILLAVLDGKGLTYSLERGLASLEDGRDRAFVQAICFGVCRYYSRLEFILNQFLTKPLKDKDRDVHLLLLVGIYQLLEMRLPSYAAVAETVKAAQKIKKTWASGLINAILHDYLRREKEIEKSFHSEESAWYAHPSWWIEKIKTAWPADWQAILIENNTHPPFALRISQQSIGREEYLKKLSQNGIDAAPIPKTSQGIVLAVPCPARQVMGFTEGWVSVQDGAAQMAASLLDLHPDQMVLDACAAPGGKLLHILDKEPQLAKVVAIEKDADRLSSMNENLARLGIAKNRVKLLCEDALKVEKWSQGECYDRILLDAPCSASGVIRRHPDIKLLRRPDDITQLAKLQFALLSALWSALKAEGILLYVTCSIFPEENEAVIQEFLAVQKDAKPLPIAADWGVPCGAGRQILPGMDNMDGFYYAKLKKWAN